MKTKSELIEEIKKLITDIEYIYIIDTVGYDKDDFRIKGPVKADTKEMWFGTDSFIVPFEYEPEYFDYDDYGKTWAFTQEELERAK